MNDAYLYLCRHSNVQEGNTGQWKAKQQNKLGLYSSLCFSWIAKHMATPVKKLKETIVI